jgi:hypothetical protein
MAPGEQTEARNGSFHRIDGFLVHELARGLYQGEQIAPLKLPVLNEPDEAPF